MAYDSEIKVFEALLARRKTLLDERTSMEGALKNAQTAKNQKDAANIQADLDGNMGEFAKLRKEFEGAGALSNPKQAWLNYWELKNSKYFDYMGDTNFEDFRAGETARRAPELKAIEDRLAAEKKAEEDKKVAEALANDPKEKERLRLARKAAEEAEANAKEEAEIKAINERTKSLDNSGPTPSGGELISKGWDGFRGFLKTILGGALGWAFGADNVNKCVDWCFDAVGNLVSGGADATKGMGKAGKAVVGVLGGLIASGPLGWIVSKIPGMGWAKGNPLLTIGSALGGAMIAGNILNKEELQTFKDTPTVKPDQLQASVRGTPTNVADLTALHKALAANPNNACAVIAPGTKVTTPDGQQYECPAPP